MLGAIAGDIIGSRWEGAGEKRYEFPLFTEHCRFTDDTVMTVAVAAALLGSRDYAGSMREVGRRYPFVGYGRSFQDWLFDASMGPYGSYGNGGAMRASPIGLAARDEEEALEEARRCAMPTHDHPEGVKGAQAVALAVFLARSGAPKETIRREVTRRFAYDLDRSVASIRPAYSFDVAAQNSVPEAIVCFLDAADYEGAVRNCVSLGGDADTMACIAGAIAEAHWGEVPAAISGEALARLPSEFIAVLDAFRSRYPIAPRASRTVGTADGWTGFLADLRRDILPIYREHERTFDEPGIHGRLHICRCIVFAEFMCRRYWRDTPARPSANDVRYAIAFHDAGRKANGSDLWGHESAALCAAYAARHPEKFARGPDAMAALLEGKANPMQAGIEACIVHDADVLDIMRPCCGHGGRDGFREPALIFRGQRDPVPVADPAVRARLVEEAWAFITATETRKEALAQSQDYFSDVLEILEENRHACPMLAEALQWGAPLSGVPDNLP